MVDHHLLHALHLVAQHHGIAVGLGQLKVLQLGGAFHLFCCPHMVAAAL